MTQKKTKLFRLFLTLNSFVSHMFCCKNISCNKTHSFQYLCGVKACLGFCLAEVGFRFLFSPKNPASYHILHFRSTSINILHPNPLNLRTTLLSLIENSCKFRCPLTRALDFGHNNRPVVSGRPQNAGLCKISHIQL